MIMKVRSGFVSNSSSSSFVILGFKTNKYIDDSKFDQLYVEYEDCDYITGYVISDGDEGIKEVELSNINEKIHEIATEYNINISDIKIYCGERPS